MHSSGHSSVRLVATVVIMVFTSTLGSILAQETVALSTVIDGKIAFSRRANNGHTRTFVMNPDGSGQMRVGDSIAPFGEEGPAWSPDGRKIAFCGRYGYPRANIFVMDADGSNQIFLTNNPDGITDQFPAWSPDGSKIAFSRIGDNGPPYRSQIYVMNADGSNPVRLTNTVDGSNSKPTWSPDGTRISYGHTAATDRGSAYSEIYVMNADGSNPTKLTTSPARTVNYWSVWSPDGGTIIFCRYGGGYGVGIYLMKSDGSNVRLIKTGGEYPVWSPDGTKIAYTSYVSGLATVHVMNADGSNDVALTLNTSSSYSSSWQTLPQSELRPLSGQ
jgi:Tol biopolymer transport system component